MSHRDGLMQICPSNMSINLVLTKHPASWKHSQNQIARRENENNGVTRCMSPMIVRQIVARKLKTHLLPFGTSLLD